MNNRLRKLRPFRGSWFNLPLAHKLRYSRVVCVERHGTGVDLDGLGYSPRLHRTFTRACWATATVMLSTTCLPKPAADGHPIHAGVEVGHRIIARARGHRSLRDTRRDVGDLNRRTRDNRAGIVSYGSRMVPFAPPWP